MSTTLDKLRLIRDSNCHSLCNDPGPFKEPICVNVDELIKELEELVAIRKNQKVRMDMAKAMMEDTQKRCREAYSDDY